MKLNEMKPTPGSRRKRKIVGRGASAGGGKTAGRGENGAKSRSGFKNKAGFEGGQNPLYIRLPKRGFKNFMRIETTIISLDDLEKLNVAIVTPEILVSENVIKSSFKRVKVLGSGTLTKKVEVSAHAFSKTAVEKIESLGGKVNLIEKKSV